MVELDKINSAEGGRDMPPPDAPGSIIPTSAPDEKTRAATETLEALQRQQPTAGLPKGSSLLTPPGEADYFEGEGLMETVQQSQRRWKIRSAPVSQLSSPNTLAGLISTITMGILPPARVLAEDLTKANLREGSQNLLQMALKGVGKQATGELMDSCGAARLGGAKNDHHHPLNQEHLPCTPVGLAPVMVQQVAAVEIPMSQDMRSSIWPCTSLMMTSLLMTHTRLYLLRMPLLFLTFQDRILKGLTVVTFYQQRSLGF